MNPPKLKRRRLLRAAHLTDLHISRDKKGCVEGAIKVLRHIHNLPERPDLILFGGDNIHDALKSTKESTSAQWALWREVFSQEVKIPFRHCLGNHDVFGWGISGNPSLQVDPDFGKAMAMRHLGFQERCYESFDFAGWHFVVLDSTHPDDSNNGHGYLARLDEEQFAWLVRDLAATPRTTPVCVISHIPILSVAAYFDGYCEKSGNWVVPSAWMHIDARRIKDLFLQHSNVKVCLSGHLHLVDDQTYLGVRYLCNGALCGGWWDRPYQGFEPMAALLDFYSDGTVDRHILTFPELNNKTPDT